MAMHYYSEASPGAMDPNEAQASRQLQAWGPTTSAYNVNNAATSQSTDHNQADAATEAQAQPVAELSEKDWEHVMAEKRDTMGRAFHEMRRQGMRWEAVAAEMSKQYGYMSGLSCRKKYKRWLREQGGSGPGEENGLE